MTTHFINGLAVEIEGKLDADRPVVLCIHGLGGSSNTWTPVLDGLSAFSIVRPDLPGSARSDLGAAKLSIDVFVVAVRQVLDTLGVGPVHVVAHSLGTIVAQHLAERHPAVVSSLALFGPLTAPPDAARPTIMTRAEKARSGPGALQEIADAIVTGAIGKASFRQPALRALVRESVMRQSPEGYAQSCEALATAQGAEIERIKVPTLLVTGDQDGVAPVGNVTAMAGRITGSRLIVLDDCGHWTPFEQPLACMQALEAFHGASS